MNFTLLRPLLALLFCLAVSAAEKVPGEPEKSPGGGMKSAQGPVPLGMATFNLDFPGGTIRDFLGAMATIHGASLSIVSAGDQEDFSTRIPPFSLRNTNVTTTAFVLSQLLLPRGFDLRPMNSDPNTIVAVMARHETKPLRSRELATQFESFQLAPHLADQSIDDIVGAIRAAWELDPQHDPNALRLKFHPPTSILLVSGPREGLDMAGKIVSQLKHSSTDAQRRQAVADEVMRRREAREKGTNKSAVPVEKK